MDLFEFINRFTRANLFGSSTIIEINGKYFLAGERQAEIAQTSPIRPVHVGIYLGKAGERFKPGFFLLELLKAQGQVKKAVVNQKAAWLFLCGRDILKESIIRKDMLEPKDDVLVLDPQGNVLGYGFYMSERIRNVLDRGDFLRRERDESGAGDEGRRPERAGRSPRTSRPQRNNRPIRARRQDKQDRFRRR